jgi:small subunit ribosomal protein S1
MEIEEGIEGLIHISELAHEHIEDVAEHFNKGDEVTAVILNIDPVEQRASLSRKRLLPFTATEYDSPVGVGQGGGARKGRRGGRRSQGIDYDYSYAVSDSGGKTTTKLGDVYADLFAQFGLADSKESDQPASESDQVANQAEPQETEAAAAESATSASDSAVQELETVEGTTADEAAPEDEMSASAPSEVVEEATAESTEPPEASARAEEEPAAKAAEEIDPENAIDAAEAAAMLTAAFREGKRPQKAIEETQPEGEGGTDTESSNEAADTSKTEPSA